MITFVLQDDRTPLFTASFNGHLDVVKALIEGGAEVNQANTVQCTAVGTLHVSSVIRTCMYM